MFPLIFHCYLLRSKTSHQRGCQLNNFSLSHVINKKKMVTIAKLVLLQISLTHLINKQWEFTRILRSLHLRQISYFKSAILCQLFLKLIMMFSSLNKVSIRLEILFLLNFLILSHNLF